MTVTKQSFAGGAEPTTLTGSLGSTDANMAVVSTTGWPDTTWGPFAAKVVDSTLTVIEKVLIASYTSTVATFDVTEGRGYDGTTAEDFGSGSIVVPCDDAAHHLLLNKHQFDLTRNDHTQYVQLSALLGIIYPVGRVILSESSTNPGTSGYFLAGVSFGTWAARAAGRSIMGVGTGTDVNSLTLAVGQGTAGDTVGEYKHTNAAVESGTTAHGHANTLGTDTFTHHHTASGENQWDHFGSGSGSGGSTGGPGNNDGMDDNNHSHAITGSVSAASAAAAVNSHNNVVPYYGAYVWARTA